MKKLSFLAAFLASALAFSQAQDAMSTRQSFEIQAIN